MLTQRVHVYGEVTKGKVLEAIRRQVPFHFKYIFTREQFMDTANHEAGEHDGTPCTWVTVELTPNHAVMPITPVEGVGVKDVKPLVVEVPVENK